MTLSRLQRFGALPATLVAMIGLLALTAVNLAWALMTGRHWFDYHSFLLSGQARNNGLNPYATFPSVFTPRFGGTAYPCPNLNPPITVYLFQAATDFNLAVGHRVWQVTSLCLVVLAAVMLAKAYPGSLTRARVAWVTCMAGVWHSLQLGQIYSPLLLAATGAWILLERRRPGAAGLLIGLLIAIKPTFVLWPLLLLVAGQRRAAVTAAGAAVGISAIPLAISGPVIYREWLVASAGYRGEVLPGNSSIISVASRFQLPAAGVVMTCLLVVALIAAAWYFRPAPALVNGLALTGAILIGPISWVGYTILLLPVVWTRSWSRPIAAAAAMLAVPFWVVLHFAGQSPHGFALAGSFYLVPVAILLVVVANDLPALRGHLPLKLAARAMPRFADHSV